MSSSAACARAFPASPVVAARPAPRPPFPSSVKGQFVDLPGVHLWYLSTAAATARRSSCSMPIPAPAKAGATQFEPLIKAGYRVIAFDRTRAAARARRRTPDRQPGSVSEDLRSARRAPQTEALHLVGDVAGGGFVALDYAALAAATPAVACRPAPAPARCGRRRFWDAHQAHRNSRKSAGRTPAIARSVRPTRAVNPKGVEMAGDRTSLGIAARREIAADAAAEHLRQARDHQGADAGRRRWRRPALHQPSLMKLWVGCPSPIMRWAMVPRDPGHSIA